MNRIDDHVGIGPEITGHIGKWPPLGREILKTSVSVAIIQMNANLDESFISINRLDVNTF